MKNNLKSLAVSGFAAALMFVMGCPQTPLVVTTDFPLNDSLGLFILTAGETQQARGTIEITGDSATVGSGTFTIGPANIVVTPANGAPGKGTVNLQGGGVIEIRVAIAATDAVDTVCDDGDSYGPFHITLDADDVPVSVDPSEVTLTPATIDLINSRGFSVCLEVTSPLDGTIDINALTFSFGL